MTVVATTKTFWNVLNCIEFLKCYMCILLDPLLENNSALKSPKGLLSRQHAINHYMLHAQLFLSYINEQCNWCTLGCRQVEGHYTLSNVLPKMNQFSQNSLLLCNLLQRMNISNFVKICHSLTV